MRSLQEAFAAVNGTVQFVHLRHAPPICQPGFIYGKKVPIDLSNEEALAQTAARLPIDADWYVSPYKRAIDTAEAVMTHMPRRKGILLHQSLREQGWGDWENRFRSELRSDDVFRSYFKDPENICPPGATGESGRMLMDRVGPALDKIALEQAKAGASYAVTVSHGGVVRAALSHAANIGFNEGLEKFQTVKPLSATTITAHVERGNVSWEINEIDWRAPALSA